MLSLVPKQCENFVPLSAKRFLPQPLTHLFHQDYMPLSYLELLDVCEQVFQSYSISQEQASQIELKTCEQSVSKIWFQQRVGRVTASKLKAAAHPDVAQPSQSLITSVCYLESTQFKNAATEWGCKHEVTALEAYKKQLWPSHVDVTISKSGLHVHI